MLKHNKETRKKARTYRRRVLDENDKRAARYRRIVRSAHHMHLSIMALS